jgi:hypothetical protein
VYLTHTDSDGFVSDSPVSVSTDGYAITSADLDFESVPEELFPTGLVGTFRVQAESETGAPVFLGVGPTDEVDEYLAGVEHIDVTRLGAGRLTYTEHDGAESPAAPADLEFWMASSEGNGTQTLDWEPESGTWTLVVMNPDAAPGVEVTASVGFNTPWLPISLIFTGGLTVLFGGLAIALAMSARRSAAPAVTTEPAPESAPLAR